MRILRETFLPCFRISAKRDIEALKESKKKLKGKYVIVVFKDNNSGFGRLLVVVSSKVGNAVMRNRIKRIIREIFRKNIRASGGYDFMIIARYSAGGAGYKEIENDLLTLLKPIIAG